MPIGNKNVVLIGFMGTGKSSIGKAIGRSMNRPVIDIDQVIEEKEKRKIRDIFEKDGETYFRQKEKEAIGEVCQRTGVVITTGGGAVLNPENMDCLKQNGLVVALSAKPETIYGRVKESHHRPLLKGENMLQNISELLEKRKPYYEKADFRFDTDGRSAA